MEIAPGAIRPNPYQPRHVFDERALDDLVASLRDNGLLQPIVVRPTDNEHFELIAGERRWRAAERLGWTRIPAVVREVDDRTLLTLALVENLQRDALSAIEEARGYHRLMEEFGASHADVASLVGRDRSTVVNALRLLKLPPAVQDMIHEGKLSAGHGRALLGLGGDATIIESVARGVVDRGLSVREVEQLGQRRRAGTKRGPRRVDPQVRAVEDGLRARLQTDVKVTLRGKSSGRLTINFYSHDDLDRILEIILGRPLPI
jgi:ParB family chromosome partitioning protein